MKHFIKRIDFEITEAFGDKDRKYRAAFFDLLSCASFAAAGLMFIGIVFAIGGAS